MVARPRIRQLGLGELLDEGFRLYRSTFVTFIAIAALVLVPYSIINYAVQVPLQTRAQQLQTNATAFTGASLFEPLIDLAFWYALALGASLLYLIVFQPLLEGALARAIAQRYLDQPTSIGDSFGTALRRAPALIGARLIPTLLGTIVFGVIGGLFVGAAAVAIRASEDGTGSAALFSVLIILLGFGLLIVAGLAAAWLAVKLLYTSQAAVVESHGAIGSIRRSWRLTQGEFWRTLGYAIVIYLIVYVLSLFPALAISLPAQFLLDAQTALLAATVAGAIVSVIATPFSAIAYTLMYFDQRVRKEGFDLEQQAQAVLPTAAPYLSSR
jgi:hypothetical protein